MLILIGHRGMCYFADLKLKFVSCPISHFEKLLKHGWCKFCLKMSNLILPWKTQLDKWFDWYIRLTWSKFMLIYMLNEIWQVIHFQVSLSSEVFLCKIWIEMPTFQLCWQMGVGSKMALWNLKSKSPTWQETFNSANFSLSDGGGGGGVKWHFEIWSQDFKLDAKLPKLQTFHFGGGGGQSGTFGTHFSYTVSEGWCSGPECE